MARKKKPLMVEHGESGNFYEVTQEQIPDLWHIAMQAMKRGDEKAKEAILKCWNIAHDLLAHIQKGR